MPEFINAKLLSYASIIDHATLEQGRQSSQMDFIDPYLVLLPDAHLGKGATVGSVIPTVGAIMPAAVGVDIGCGMMAIRTQFHREAFSPDQCREIHRKISDTVPSSAGNYNDGRRYSYGTARRIATLEEFEGYDQAEKASDKTNWRRQLGSLGSGNHFIEVSADEDDRVWLFLHSGSRGVGNRIAQYHIKVAQDECKDVRLPNRDLAYLTEGTDSFRSYIEGLRWAQMFAALNRADMMDRVVAAVEDTVGEMVVEQDTVACHHNYTVEQELDGKYVWLSRKGAINASEGVRGLIPGSMGDRSYVVIGKGNAQALNSAPHGAGRQHSRSSAKRTFTREDLDARMEGVTWGESDAFLDEHPDAYKPIDTVMLDAADLVEVQHELRQFINVKGS